MTATLCNEQQTPGVPQQIATHGLFRRRSWHGRTAPLVPFAKTRIGIDDGSLGLLLLCIGAGSMLAMPLTGFLTGKLGCRAVILMAGLGLCIDLPLLALMDSLGGMAVALLLFGAAIGMIDVAMNVQAVIVERASGKAMMSGFSRFLQHRRHCRRRWRQRAAVAGPDAAAIHPAYRTGGDSAAGTRQPPSAA